ncbi:redoxin domain-containing protein [Parasediminibacterium paludis]|uniref:Redoxin domain-containing protein n=1 Tax=Parasediminibacterium paludis TaxID=908966 RepID=A0ABV8PTW0_9BACT
MATTTPQIQASIFSQVPSVSTRQYNYGYYPLLKGDIAPIFQLHQSSFVSIQHFFEAKQPLVIAFYTNLLNNTTGIQQLETLQTQVNQHGGNLIIITSNTSKAFKKAIASATNLNVFVDADNSIAELFGLYDDANPLTNWLSGIEDAAAALPALYVINPERQIVHHFIDYQFELFGNANTNNHFTDGVFEAVDNIYNTYTYLNVRYNKLVS